VRLRERVFDREARPLPGAFAVASPASAGCVAMVCATAAWAWGTWVVGWVGAADVSSPTSPRRVFVRKLRRRVAALGALAKWVERL